mgnify:CR=1 FL=1
MLVEVSYVAGPHSRRALLFAAYAVQVAGAARNH